MMHITFDDIVQARQDVEDKLNNLTQIMRKEAGEFLTQYRNSLSTGREVWSDGNRTYPFARITNCNEQGLSRLQPVNELVLDARNSVSFVLETVVDINTNGGSWESIDIRMYQQGRSIIIEIHPGNRCVEIPFNSGDNSYFEACKAVKETVVEKIRSRLSN
ncbi:hypothetical protein ACOZ0V_003891 [Cronobacter malonaticus]|nr:MULTISPECIES: hypothetical protein [Cronobacter]ELQ6048152.1 hypothetical protein [Cronobacter malonaticus]ELQ6068762.1 hypothetical protein [Cronobacter malonaticus]ELY4445913.1 hypothetical protein [Cronobacter malonaticus]ELY4491422.1 hypothetical protein [Cronobacter malonaticus]ELY6296864.1 hypothetical protein [Cronobacter malonaticus]